MKELGEDPQNSKIAQNAAIAFDWSSVIDQKRSDAASMIKHARGAQLLFLEYSEKFEYRESEGKAWGLAGASSATTRIAEVLGGSPPGYQPKLLDGKNRLEFHDLAVGQAVSAISEALSRDAMAEVNRMLDKLNDAVSSQVAALASLGYTDKVGAVELINSDTHKLVAAKYEEIFTRNPTGKNAFDWAYSGRELLGLVWKNSLPDLKTAEHFSREMLGELETEFPKNTENPEFLIGFTECMHSLATTISFQANAAPPGDDRSKNFAEVMAILNIALQRSEAAFQVATTKNFALAPFAKSQLVWNLERLLQISKENQLMIDQVPLWESRLLELER